MIDQLNTRTEWLGDSRHHEIYFLPDGGEPGRDEFPIHTAIMHSSLTLTRPTLRLPVLGAGVFDIRHIANVSIDYEVAMLAEPQNWNRLVNHYGIFTVINGLDTREVFHFHGMVESYNFPLYPDGVPSHEFSIVGNNPKVGYYTVERQWAVIRLDLGDGCYKEKPLIQRLKLDDVINNRRYKWE